MNKKYMNKTEKIAYKYLLSLGYVGSDIRFHSNISPDFVTRDGKRWEVKKGSDKRKAIFTSAQLLFMDFNTTIIFVANDNIITTRPFYEIMYEMGLGRLVICVDEKNNKEYNIAFACRLKDKEEAINRSCGC